MTLPHGRDKCNNYLIVALRYGRQGRKEKWADVVLLDSTSSQTLRPFFILNMREISLRENVSSGLHLAHQQGENGSASGYAEHTGLSLTRGHKDCVRFTCGGHAKSDEEADRLGEDTATEAGESPAFYTYGRVSIERSGTESICHINLSDKSSSTPREGALVTFSGFDSHRPVYNQSEMIA